MDDIMLICTNSQISEFGEAIIQSVVAIGHLMWQYWYVCLVVNFVFAAIAIMLGCVFLETNEKKLEPIILICFFLGLPFVLFVMFINWIIEVVRERRQNHDD